MRLHRKVCLVGTILCVSVATLSFAAAKKPKIEAPKASIGDKPQINRLEPRGFQRGKEITLTLTGTNLNTLKQVKFSSNKLTAQILESTVTKATLKVKAEANVPRAAYDLSVVTSKGESANVKLYIDDLPVVSENSSNTISSLKLPFVFWGTLNPATDNDIVEFQAKGGQNLVFDLSAKTLGSKANVTITLLDAQNNVLASNNSFDEGDPLLVYTTTKTGTYRLRISEETMAGSPDHFYRLSAGELPVVVGVFPLSVAKASKAQVELIGYNLPETHSVQFNADKTGEVDVPIDTEKFRSRRAFKILVTDGKEVIESEPNKSESQATEIPVPGVAAGRISPSKAETTDIDCFRFTAKKNQHLIIETEAMRRGSPVDTRIEVLYPDGRPVPQILLQAVRDSQINFRPIDSNSPDVRVENWQEMELNELMYLQGEVCKIFRMPEGPDSGFRFYSAGGKRLSYFNTTPISHALDEPCYIVEPHPVGAKLVSNGLPTFTLNYENDDDSERKLGSDSRISFQVPDDGTYIVRVSDSRGFSGERFVYRLIIREAMPDFKVTLNNATPTVSPGNGQEFSFAVERIDDFDGAVRLDIVGAPTGFLISTPLEIQAGQLEAKGTINAADDAKEPTAEQIAGIKITATGTINGKAVTKQVSGFTQIKVGGPAKLLVALEPYTKETDKWIDRSIADKPLEITIAPGQILPIWLKMKRNGHEDLVSFSVEDLPHGVIVDNIGLNGVVIPKGENERQVFLKAAKWVPDTDRIAYCQAKQAGAPTSLPVIIHVRRAANQQTARK